MTNAHPGENKNKPEINKNIINKKIMMPFIHDIIRLISNF